MAETGHGRGSGFVLLCDDQGRILEVLLDELGVASGLPPEQGLERLVYPLGNDKMPAFLKEVNARGAALLWEISTLSGEGVETLNYFGVRRDEGVLVIASRTPDSIFMLYEELLSMLNEQAGSLRSMQQRSDGNADDIQIMEDFMRVNNELVNVRRELTLKNLQLEELLREQERHRQIKEDVERIMQHDLKTPLTPIINLPYLLRDSPRLNQDERSMLLMIEEAGRRMLRMINHSLDLYKMETGVYQLRPQSVDLAGMLRVSAQGLLNDATVKDGLSLDFYLHGDPLGPEDVFMVLGEDLLCRSLLDNLLDNALQASPPKGTVRVELDRDAGLARIRIHNQGEVPEAVRENFFGKYVTHGKFRGTGLGTYSAQLMARVQGGDVEMDTGPEGTTLTVLLPPS